MHAKVGRRRAAITIAIAAMTISALTGAMTGTANASTPIQCTGKQVAHFSPPTGPLPKPTSISIYEDYGAPGGGTCLSGPFSSAHGDATTHPPLASCLVGLPPPRTGRLHVRVEH